MRPLEAKAGLPRICRPADLRVTRRINSPSMTPHTPFETLADDELMLSEDKHLSRPLVYAFEHKVLPKVFFLNHPELNGALAAEPTHGEAFLHFWSMSAISCEDGGLFPPDSISSEEYFAYQRPLMDSVTCEPSMGPDYSVWIIRMPAPKTLGEAFFAAMCRRTNGSHEYMVPSSLSRYFTAEKAFTPDTVCFCEWSQDGGHLNYGEIPTPTQEQFLASVREVLARRRA